MRAGHLGVVVERHPFDKKSQQLEHSLAELVTWWCKSFEWVKQKSFGISEWSNLAVYR
jgi:hypothetical protein